jgi:SAM-dependent methyltransferase
MNTQQTEYFDPTEFEHRASIEDGHYWHVHRRAVLVEAVRALWPPETTGRLIELGCGIGTVATHFNQNGYVVDYGEYFENAIAIAKTRAVRKLGEAGAEKRKFLKVDVTQPLTMTGYQGAFLLDLIEHVPEDELALRHVREMIGDAPNGFVVVTVPAFQFLWSPWDDVERHKRRYSKRGLESVLDRAGFDVVRTTYFFTPLFFAAAGVKTLRTLREAVAPAPKASHMSELTESTNVPLLNRVVVGAHLPERMWLAARRTLPFGTSLLALARTR